MIKTYLLIPIIGLLFNSSSCLKEKGFTIAGKVTGFADSSKVYLKNWSTEEILDSTWIDNNEFMLEGKLNDLPENLLLYIIEAASGKFIYTNLLIGNESIQVNGDIKDFPWHVTITGSPIQDVANQLNQIEYNKTLQQDKLSLYLSSLPDSSRQSQEKEVKEKLKTIADSTEQVKLAFLKKNFNTYAALVNFIYYKNSFDSATLHALYNRLSRELKQTMYGKAIKMQLDNPAPQLGDTYYDFEALDEKGSKHTLSEIRNKYILLHFSHAACFPSVSSLKELKSMNEKYEDTLSIVKISLDVKKQDWMRSLQRDTIPWLNLWDGKGNYSPAVIKYGILGTPNFILISPDKKVVSRWFGYEEGMIEREIQKALNKFN